MFLFCGLVFHVLHVANNGALLDPCHLCALCNICACSSCLHVCSFAVVWSPYVRQLLSDIRLIWRGWTGDGRWGASSAGSRAEVNCITSLSPSLCYCSPHPLCYLLSLITWLRSSLSHIFVQSRVLCCLPANAFIMSNNPPQLTTNWR